MTLMCRGDVESKNVLALCRSRLGLTLLQCNGIDARFSVCESKTEVGNKESELTVVSSVSVSGKYKM